MSGLPKRDDYFLGLQPQADLKDYLKLRSKLNSNLIRISSIINFPQANPLH